jgi:hypothetical protein
MTIFSTTLAGFNFATNDPNNSVNGRSILALASIGAAGVAPFGVAPGIIPGVTGCPTNVRADGLSLGPSVPLYFAPAIPPAAVETINQNPNWLQAASEGAPNPQFPASPAVVPAASLGPQTLPPVEGGANIASTIA